MSAKICSLNSKYIKFVLIFSKHVWSSWLSNVLYFPFQKVFSAKSISTDNTVSELSHFCFWLCFIQHFSKGKCKSIFIQRTRLLHIEENIPSTNTSYFIVQSLTGMFGELNSFINLRNSESLIVTSLKYSYPQPSKIPRTLVLSRKYSQAVVFCAVYYFFLKNVILHTFQGTLSLKLHSVSAHAFQCSERYKWAMSFRKQHLTE